MKKKIYQLAKEEFEYSQATLILKEDRIKKEAEEGKNAEGTLFIRNSDNRRMKGILYTTAPFICLRQNTFSGTEALIDYELSGAGRKAGEVLSGEIYLVTSCGEYRIYVELEMKENEEKKKAGNLFRLTNLARSDWALAVEQYKRLYARRSEGPASQELEEFLIDGNKKKKVSISTESRDFYYGSVTDSFADSLILKKDEWGYLQVQVWSDADFLQPEHKVIWGDNFIGSEYILEFLILKDKLHDGRNYGRLYIRTIHQLLTVEVCAVSQSRSEKKALKRREREAVLVLVHNYMQYRCGLLEQTAYAREGLLFRRENQEVFSEKMNRFLEIYFMVLDGQTALARELLKDIFPEGTEERAAWLYLTCISKRDQEGESVQKEIEALRQLHQEEPDNLHIVWFLLQVDLRLLEDTERRFSFIQIYSEGRMPSILLEIELLEALNEKPELMKELTPSIVGAMNLGIRMNMAAPKIRERYIFLAAREKRINNILPGLMEMYHQAEGTEAEEALSAVLHILIRKKYIGERYFSWYEKGVMEQIRVKGLYEAYLCSAKEKEGFHIPRQVVSYFAYDNLLPDTAKEFLYAYIVCHKKADTEIYPAFSALIEQFGLEQLSKARINQNLAVIYKEILVLGELDTLHLKGLSGILFRQGLTCYNPNMTGVYVKHKEISKEEYVSLENGRADIYLYTDNPVITFVDEKGQRYGSSVAYKVENYLDLPEWHTDCYLADPGNSRLLLNLYEKIEKYQKFDENANEIRKRVLEIPGLLKPYAIECQIALIHQYFDKMEEQPLREELLRFEPELVPEKERAKLIDYCILQGLDERAYELIKRWGYRKVPLNRLLRLTRRLLEKVSGKEEVLLSMCSYLLKCGRSNEVTLTYLVLFQESLLEYMAQVWEKAKESGVETWPLEERILAQLLFTGGYIKNHIGIFTSYYRQKKDMTLVRAYLNFYAYQYFVKGSSLPAEFFTFLPKEIEKEYSRIMVLAYLLEKSGKDMLSEEEKKRVKDWLGQFLEQNQIFAFFRKFGDMSLLEGEILNRTFIEYRTAPGRKVSLSYRIEDMDGFRTIPMVDLGYGIYTADFLLFSDEVLQYYITEAGEEEELITESYIIAGSEGMRELENSAFGLLGAILAARQLKDDTAAEELMAEYILQEYRKERLFSIL